MLAAVDISSKRETLTNRNIKLNILMSNSDDEYYILIGRVTLLVDRRTYMLAAVGISSRRENQ